MAALNVLARAVGEPAMRRALPLYAAIVVVSAVIFGPTGMSASEVTDQMAGSRWVRGALWAAWLIGIAPAMRVACRAEGAFYLRALPIRLVGHLGFSGLLGLGVQAPWIWLHARGDDLLAAGAAGAMAAAAGALVALRPRGPLDQLGRVALIGGLGWALWAPLGDALLLVLGALVYPLALAAAWARAPERRSRVDLLTVRGPATIAMGLSAVAYLWRRRRSALGRAALFTAAGAGFAALTARSNQLAGESLGSLTLAVGGMAVAAAMGGIAAAAVEHERGTRWLLDSTGAGGGLRVAAAAGPLIVFGALVGLLYGGLTAWAAAGTSTEVVRVVGLGLLSGIAWASIALVVARYCERDDGVNGTLVFVIMLLGSLVIAVSTVYLGEAAALAVLALAGGGQLVMADRVERA